MTEYAIGVVGAGAFGTALALSMSRTKAQVSLITRSQEQATQLLQDQENRRYLAGVHLPEAIHVSASPEDLRHVDLILLATPAQAIASTLQSLPQYIPSSTPIVLCAKGIDLSQTRLLTDVARSVVANPLAVLSGPSFAKDVALGRPVALILAADFLGEATKLARLLRHDRFRCYASSDIIGVQIGGALKNVMAIASGIVEGRDLGQSAQAALLSRALAEISRVGVALGAKQETFMGLSGIGDLILTGSNMMSRNYSFGVELGKGRSMNDILGERVSVTEGVTTSSAIYLLVKQFAQKNGDEPLHTPLIDSIYRLLHTQMPGQSASDRLNETIEAILSRQSETEF